MPLYEYECKEHGTFEAQRPLAEFEAPGRCPGCSVPAPRVLSTPRVRLVGPGERIGRERNEKSQHEPTLITRPSSPGGAARWASAGAMPWAVGH